MTTAPEELIKPVMRIARAAERLDSDVIKR